MIDLHSHILWDMDDGSESLEESLSMASIAVEEGIKTMVATPHCIDEQDLEAFSLKIRERCKTLNETLDRKDLFVRVIPGAEIYMDLAMLELKGWERLTIGETGYILVEMPMGEVPRYAEDFLYHLQLKGLKPIIAHPERNRGIMADPNILARFIELGSLAQINTGSIFGFFGTGVQECARILLTHNMGHALGTDAHSDGRRGPYIKQAIGLLYEWLGKGMADKIIYSNSETILKGNELSIDSPMEYRKRKGIFKLFRKK